MKETKWMSKFTKGFIFKLKMKNYSFDVNGDKDLPWFMSAICWQCFGIIFDASNCIRIALALDFWVGVLIKRFEWKLFAFFISSEHFSFKRRYKSLHLQFSMGLKERRSKSHKNDDLKWKLLVFEWEMIIMNDQMHRIKDYFCKCTE